MILKTEDEKYINLALIPKFQFIIEKCNDAYELRLKDYDNQAPYFIYYSKDKDPVMRLKSIIQHRYESNNRIFRVEDYDYEADLVFP